MEIIFMSRLLLSRKESVCLHSFIPQILLLISSPLPLLPQDHPMPCSTPYICMMFRTKVHYNQITFLSLCEGWAMWSLLMTSLTFELLILIPTLWARSLSHACPNINSWQFRSDIILFTECSSWSNNQGWRPENYPSFTKRRFFHSFLMLVMVKKTSVNLSQKKLHYFLKKLDYLYDCLMLLPTFFGWTGICVTFQLWHGKMVDLSYVIFFFKICGKFCCKIMNCAIVWIVKLKWIVRWHNADKIIQNKLCLLL